MIKFIYLYARAYQKIGGAYKKTMLKRLKIGGAYKKTMLKRLKIGGAYLKKSMKKLYAPLKKAIKSAFRMFKYNFF